jgi:hypothetical protein
MPGMTSESPSLVARPLRCPARGHCYGQFVVIRNVGFWCSGHLSELTLEEQRAIFDVATRAPEQLRRSDLREFGL